MLFWLSLCGLTAICLLQLAGNWRWEALAISNFRPHLAIASLPLLALAWRFGKKWALLLALFCLASTAYPFGVALTQRATIEESGDAAQLKVASFNLRFDNDKEDALLDEILRLDADVLFLSEVVPARRELIAALRTRYPYHAFNGANPGAPGEALFSRYPLSDEKRAEVSPTAPFWQVALIWQENAIDLFAGHPPPALGARLDERHAAWFKAAGETLTLRQADRPLLIVGDLNATPWSTRLAAILQAGDLKWTFAGGTWPSTFPSWLALPIDHILVSSHFAVVKAALGKPAGSDHRPLVVDLTLQPSTSAVP